ncbi:MAG TPA: hypothetical protein VJW96_08960 [Terriglobales bacterium]|jgi:hypothetical protein|nr:hypothetical protein [Terriglobales bacterium]
MDCVNRGILTLVGFFPLLVLAAPAEARLNLLQSKQVMTLPATLVGSIRASLEPSSTGPVAFAAPIQADLVRALPQDFRAACPSLMESWGDIAKGTGEWRVRVLVRQDDQLWLAFRCASRALGYEKDYDERPALLRLATGKLEFLPLGPDAENDSTLYHIEFSELLPLEGAQGVALKVTEPAGNACCDGPESRSGETWRVFADSPHGVAELLSVTTARDDSSHCDDPEVDSETTYRAQIALDRDAQNRAREVAVTFRKEVKDITYEGEKANPHTVSQRSGTLRYRWIPASLHFEEIK